MMTKVVIPTARLMLMRNQHNRSLPFLVFSVSLTVCQKLAKSSGTSIYIVTCKWSYLVVHVVHVPMTATQNMPPVNTAQAHACQETEPPSTFHEVVFHTRHSTRAPAQVLSPTTGETMEKSPRRHRHFGEVGMCTVAACRYPPVRARQRRGSERVRFGRAGARYRTCGWR